MGVGTGTGIKLAFAAAPRRDEAYFCVTLFLGPLPCLYVRFPLPSSLRPGRPFERVETPDGCCAAARCAGLPRLWGRALLLEAAGEPGTALLVPLQWVS